MSEEIKFTVIGVDKSQKALKSIGANLKKASKLARNFAVGAAAATTAITIFTKKIADGIDKQAKFASRIGVSIEELTQYQYVADLAGISTETFNMATQRMTRRVAEAANDLGEAQGALKELNIDAKAFANLSLDDQMQTLADQMANVQSESERLRLAFKLFDSEGTAMLQMLNQGSEAMREAARDAQFLGLVISRQAAANAEAFTDSMTRVSGALKGVSQGIAGELMPIMTGLANNFANFVAKNRAGIVSFAKTAIQNFVTLGVVIGQTFDHIKKVFSDPAYMQAFLDNIQKLPAIVGAMVIQLGKSISIAFHAMLEGIGLQIIEFALWAKDAINPFKDAGDLSDRIANTFVFALERAKEKISATVSETAAFAKIAFEDAGSIMGEAFGVDLQVAQEQAQAAIESISEFGTVAGEKLQETAANTNQFLEEVRSASQIFWEEQNNWAQTFSTTFYETMAQTLDSISNGIATLAVEGGSMMDMLKNIAKTVLQQVIAAFVKMGIQRLILSKISAGATKAEAVAQGSKAVGTAFANGIASMAGAPFPMNLTAPAFGASMGAAAASGFTSGAAIGAGVGAALPVAHGGLTNNPNEQTFLLRRGERVLSPDQNNDLTGFLNNPAGESSSSTNQVIIETLNVSVLENATNAEALFNLSRDDLSSLMADPIIDALNDQERIGILPNFAEKMR